MSDEPCTKTVERRDTARKKLIRRVIDSSFNGRPVLLEELRWAVNFAELNRQERSRYEMTRSWVNSFARTIRGQFSQYRIRKVPITDETALGIVARAAVYRLKKLRQLRQFLDGSAPCILCRYKTDIHVDEPRYEPRSRYITPHHYAVTFRFFPDGPTKLSYSTIEQWPGVYIPGTHYIPIVVPPNAEITIEPLSNVPWTLFGYNELNDWHEVNPLGNLSQVKRNSRF